jgi:GNAT superfamily N-acetyltransferase
LTAEVAFEVADEHQGRRIGSALAEALTADARAAGILEFHATVRGDNQPVISLLSRATCGLRATWLGGGKRRLVAAAQQSQGQRHDDRASDPCSARATFSAPIVGASAAKLEAAENRADPITKLGSRIERRDESAVQVQHRHGASGAVVVAGELCADRVRV